jgi:hypothetical protein
MGPPRSLVRREAIAIARTSGFWTATVFHATVLTAFVAVWGNGLPIHGGGTVFEQLLALEAVLLSIVLSWAAIRCSVPEPRDRLVAVAVATGSTPSGIVLAKCLTLALALAAIVASGLPLLMTARQVPGLTLAEATAAVWPLAALAPFAAALAVSAALALDSRLLGWLAAAAACVVATAIVPLSSVTAPIYLGAAVGLTWLAARHADAHLRYEKTPGVLSLDRT